MNLVQLTSFIMNLSVLVFVLTSMLAMGLSLTVAQILAPLRNARLVILSLAANFVLAPMAAYLITQAFPLTDGLKTGLILVSTASGAPFLPRLAQMAKGNLAFSVGLMVLLMVTTVLYMPLMLPLLVHGVTVNPWDIARPLIFLMLLPLAAALYFKARYTQRADSLAPYLAKASNIALILLVAAGLLANLDSLLGIIGSTAILAGLIFLAVCFAMGFLLGGKQESIRVVLGFGTAQRNLSAALVVAAANFAEDPDIIVMVLVFGLIGLILLILTALLLGRRSR